MSPRVAIGQAQPVGLRMFGAGRYYPLQASVGISNTNSLGVGTLRLAPVLITNPITITRLAAEIATAGDIGSRLRLGIYANDPTTDVPKDLLLDAGQINGDSATPQEIVLGSPLTLGPGVYWSGGVVQAVTITQPTVRSITNMMGNQLLPTHYGTSLPAANQAYMGFFVTGVTGALPATLTAASMTPTGVVARILAKIA